MTQPMTHPARPTPGRVCWISSRVPAAPPWATPVPVSRSTAATSPTGRTTPSPSPGRRARLPRPPIATGEIRRYAFVHASPPCQHECALTVGTNASQGWGRTHVDLVAPTRELLDAAGLPYVIEQPNGRAEIRKDLTLCGEMFGLGVIRHRNFELGGWTHRAAGARPAPGPCTRLATRPVLRRPVRRRVRQRRRQAVRPRAAGRDGHRLDRRRARN